VSAETGKVRGSGITRASASLNIWRLTPPR
jgi:hypothetical protein